MWQDVYEEGCIKEASGSSVLISNIASLLIFHSLLKDVGMRINPDGHHTVSSSVSGFSSSYTTFQLTKPVDALFFSFFFFVLSYPIMLLEE